MDSTNAYASRYFEDSHSDVKLWSGRSSMDEEESDVVGGSEGGGCHGGDDAAGENNTPWGAIITGRSSVRGGWSTSFRMRHNHRRCCPNASTVGEVMPPNARKIYWKGHENEEGVVHQALHEMLSLDEWTAPDFCKMLKLPAPESVRG